MKKKKVAVVLIGSLVGTKLFFNYQKRTRHRLRETAKPFAPTLVKEHLHSISENTAKGKKTCLVIGGGIAGVSTAHELCAKGHNVLMLERCSDTGLQCSSAPAGGMQRSNPSVDNSMWMAALRSLFGLVPCRYFRISLWETLTDPHFVRWFFGFTYNGFILPNETHDYYQNQMLDFTNWAIDSMLSDISKFDALSDGTHLNQNGALKLYFSDDDFKKAKEYGGWTKAPDGESTIFLTRDEVLSLEPCIVNMYSAANEKKRIVGGAFQQKAASGNCYGYLRGAMKLLHQNYQDLFHVESDISVTGFDSKNGTITQVHTSRGPLDVPPNTEIIVAAGSWTPIILRMLGLYCPTYPMKGYNMIVNLDEAGLKASDFPSRIVVDDFMFSTTINKEVRLASIGEFAGWSTDPDPSVTLDLKRQVCRMYPSLSVVLSSNNDIENVQQMPKGISIKTGLRPFVNDGRLLTGRISAYNNLLVNVGPGFNGWKVATGAAKVLEASVSGDTKDLPSTFDPTILSPEDRVVMSPMFCKLVDILTYNY